MAAALRSWFERFAATATRWSGSAIAFVLALTIVLVWIVTGPLFHFSDAWQLVINTGTTIVTFLMVFLIQSSQNRDSLALHLKLDELIRAQSGASNALVSAESMSEEELRAQAERFAALAEAARARAAGGKPRRRVRAR